MVGKFSVGLRSSTRTPLNVEELVLQIDRYSKRIPDKRRWFETGHHSEVMSSFAFQNLSYCLKILVGIKDKASWIVRSHLCWPSCRQYQWLAHAHCFCLQPLSNACGLQPLGPATKHKYDWKMVPGMQHLFATHHMTGKSFWAHILFINRVASAPGPQALAQSLVQKRWKEAHSLTGSWSPSHKTQSMNPKSHWN